MFKKILGAAAVSIAALGGVAAVTSTASAAPLPAPLVHATTHVINRADSGNGGTWATDNFSRTLTIVKSLNQSNAGAGNTLYTAIVTDDGGFTAHAGALAPNQVVPGVHVAHTVNGSFKGGLTYTVKAPSNDSLTGMIPALENDAAGVHVTTANWPAQAFHSAVGVQVSENAGWAWKYSTACESWTDSSFNGDGNTAGAGNITGKFCVPVIKNTAPYVYAGHVVTENNTQATVGWSDSKFGWPAVTNFVHGNHCVEVYMYGPGFTDPSGGAHVGFTCDNGNPAANLGYLKGMEPGHTYALYVRPAQGTYQHHSPIPGTSAGAHITVITTA